MFSRTSSPIAKRSANEGAAAASGEPPAKRQHVASAAAASASAAAPADPAKVNQQCDKCHKTKKPVHTEEKVSLLEPSVCCDCARMERVDRGREYRTHECSDCGKRTLMHNTKYMLEQRCICTKCFDSTGTPAERLASLESVAKYTAMTDVIHVLVLGEENNGSWEYVVRVADIPGGLTEFLRQLALVDEDAQCYRKGVPVAWKDVTEDELYAGNDVGTIVSLIKYMAIWKSVPTTGKAQQNRGYMTPPNHRVVWSGPVFDQF